jgi:hypothetical protein
MTARRFDHLPLRHVKPYDLLHHSGVWGIALSPMLELPEIELISYGAYATWRRLHRALKPDFRWANIPMHPETVSGRYAYVLRPRNEQAVLDVQQWLTLGETPMPIVQKVTHQMRQRMVVSNA